MKTVLVADLHGQIEIAEQALELDMPVVFMGDYLDSFDRSVADQVELLMLVLDAVEDGLVQALMGNHEMSYLESYMRASGYKAATSSHVIHLESRMREHLKPYLWVEGFLLSHAGVSNRMLETRNLTLHAYLDKNEFSFIGRSRGGNSPEGGLYWCDWNHEFEPIEAVPQIVGHTRGRGIRQKGNSFCIDCLEDGGTELPVIENGKIVDLIKLKSS